MKTVFVDMDGVVADFVGRVASLHNISPEQIQEFKGRYDIIEVLDMPPKQFWGAIDADEEFWSHLELTPEAHSIMDELEEAMLPAQIYFLSSPSLSPKCYSGKAHWIQKHFPDYINRLIVTQHKHFLTGKDRDRILIDDSDKNIDSWRKHGGTGILLPRPWNSLHAFSHQTLTMFKADTRRFIR